MASKIHSHHVYVAITPYKVDGSSAEEFNELDVMTAYDDRAKHFYVNLHPGWKTDYGHGCIIMGGDDPLTASKWVKVKDSPKNSQKTINEMGAALELAKDAIAWLFDKRDWQRLYAAVRNIALNGYTEHYKQQMEKLMQADKEPVKQQPVMQQVDVMGLMNALKTNGTAKLSDFAKPVETEVSEPLKKWNDLKKKHPDAILLFRCGDFYECYQEDADVVAKVCGITLSKCKGLGETEFYRTAGFPHHALDTYLPKLVRAGKRIAICDEIINGSNESNKEDETMRLNMDANNNETKNVAMEPQVNNNPIEDAQAVEVTTEADVQEVDDIAPKVTKKKVAEAMVQAANGGEATTIPMGQHGSIVIAGVGSGQKPAVKPQTSDLKPQTSTKVQDSVPQEQPDPEAVGELAGMLTKVRLVTYMTRNNEAAPRIVGFSGEDDPRWKPINDEKKMLIEAYNKAKKKDGKAKAQSSPFGPAWLTDRETNEKTYVMTFGTKYMDVAKALCEAYNTTDRMAWHKAEEAVRDLKKSIAEGYKAEREARKAERAAARDTKGSGTSVSYSSEDVAAMLRKVMAGGDVPEDIKKLLKAA